MTTKNNDVMTIGLFSIATLLILSVFIFKVIIGHTARPTYTSLTQSEINASLDAPITAKKYINRDLKQLSNDIVYHVKNYNYALRDLERAKNTQGADGVVDYVEALANVQKYKKLMLIDEMHRLEYNQSGKISW